MAAYYNLGGGSRIRVNEAIAMLQEISGKELKVNFAEKQKGDMRHTFASIELAKQDLGYSPTNQTQ